MKPPPPPRKPLRGVLSMDESKLPSLDIPSLHNPLSSFDSISNNNNTTTSATTTFNNYNNSKNGTGNGTGNYNSLMPNNSMIVLNHTDHHQRMTSIQFNSIQAIADHIGHMDLGDEDDSNTDSSTTSQGQISTKSSNQSTTHSSCNKNNLSPPSSPPLVPFSSPKPSSPLVGLLKFALGPKKKINQSSSPSTTTVDTTVSSSVNTLVLEKKKKKNKENQKIDLNDYVFTYEKIITNNETTQIFLKFLTVKKTSESLLFVLKFRELKAKFNQITNEHDQQLNIDKKTHYRNTLKTIEELYKCFFAFDSAMELNLPQNLHEPTTKIMEEYESKKDKLMDDTIENHNHELFAIITTILNEFKKIESYLNLNLKECQFLEFLEWEKFRKFIVNKGSIHLSEVAELKPYSHSSFVESLVSEMSKPRITVKQAKQIKHLVVKNTSIWSPIITESNYIVSLSNNQYLLGEEESNSSNNKGVYFFKYEITFPYPKQAVINTLLSTKLRFKFDKNTKMLSKIDYFPKEDNENLATCITQEVYELPFPFQSREMVLACAVFNDLTDNSTMLCLRSCESDKTVKLKRTVKAKNVGCWIFQDLNGTHTRYIQFVGADFKGFLPPKLVTKNVAKRAKYYYSDSLKMFEKPEDDFKEPENDPLFSGFMDTLKENGNLTL